MKTRLACLLLSEGAIDAPLHPRRRR
ncbi:hypothetical protein [Ralstonia pickettii]